MWDPFREFQSLRREIDRAFGGGDGYGRGDWPRWRLAFLPGRGARMYPLINLHDDGDNFYVEALMPGVEPDQVEVTVVGNGLTIAGEKRGPQNIPPERIHRMERAAGRFIRSVQLPAEVERDRVNAEYRHGMLMLTLPRSEAAKPKRVEIRAGDAGNRMIDQGEPGQTGTAVAGEGAQTGQGENRGS
jgi:HSP20 family protein